MRIYEFVNLSVVLLFVTPLTNGPLRRYNPSERYFLYIIFRSVFLKNFIFTTEIVP